MKKLLFFIVTLCYSQSLNTVKIDSIKNSIHQNLFESKSNFQVVEICFGGFSAEGTEGKAYLREGNLTFVDIIHIGETFNSKEKLYFYKSTLVYLSADETRYNGFNYGAQDPSKNKKSSEEIYLDQGQIIKLTLNGDLLENEDKIQKQLKYVNELQAAIKVAIKEPCEYNP